MKILQHLIGTHVTAICSYGALKGQEIFGILDQVIAGDYIVTVIYEDGSEWDYSVDEKTIKEV